MNATFKVVFNKARGALMVVNEATSSIQAKGTKTVIAAAACLVSGASLAQIGIMANGADSIVNAGTNGENYSITVGDEGALAAVAAFQGKLTIVGQNISIASTGKDSYAAYSQDAGILTIGNDLTESVEVNGVFAGVMALTSGSTINVVSNKIAVNSSDFGVHVQNNTEDSTAPKDHATVSLKADEIVVNSKNLGLSAFSNGQMDISGNLTVNAVNALDVRGNSTMNVNVDGNHTTVLNGDVVFETPNSPSDSQNSGKIINAYVNLGLHGEGSVWTGRSYQEYTVGDKLEKIVELEVDPYHGNVTGFNVAISDGGIWNVTDDSFVNTLTLTDGGIVSVGKTVKTFNVGKVNGDQIDPGIVVKGKGNLLTLGDETAFGGSITIAKDGELITNLASAFTGATVSETNALTLAEKLDARLKFAESQDGVLSISDAFTYTGSDLTKLTEVYADSVGLNFANASLLLAEDEPLNVTTDVTTGSVTGGNNVTVSGTGALTIAGEGETSEIGTLTVDTNGTLKVNNNSSVTLDALAGSGTVYVGNDESAGKLAVDNLTFDGLIVLDPEFATGSTITDASNFALTSLADPVGTQFAAGLTITKSNQLRRSYR